MSTSAYGGELRLFSQVVTLANKLGDAEQMLKTFAGNRELLVFVLDYVAFNHGQGFSVRDDQGKQIIIRLVCFSETSEVSNDEANRRVKRFGRYVTEGELKQLFDLLSGHETQFELCYPIVTHSIATGCRVERYEHKEISFDSFHCRVRLSSTGSSADSNKKTGMIWAPATFFAVVPRPLKEVEVLLPRPKSGK